MVAVIIFYIHVIFLVYIFTKSYVEDGALAGFLSIIFIIIIFSAGWTISEFIMSLFMKPEGINIFFPRYAFSLLLLTSIETVLYWFYYFKKKKS